MAEIISHDMTMNRLQVKVQIKWWTNFEKWPTLKNLSVKNILPKEKLLKSDPMMISATQIQSINQSRKNKESELISKMALDSFSGKFYS